MQDAAYTASVFIALDHDDEVMAVFSTRAAAEAYIAVEWAGLRPPVTWRVEEFEVRDADSHAPRAGKPTRADVARGEQLAREHGWT